MRLDKFTTKFQQALGEAQSLAIGHDNQMIEPQHLPLALLEQEDGGTGSLLARAGVNVPALRTDLDKAIDRLPQVSGHGGDVSVGRDLGNLLNLTDKGSAEARRPVHRFEMFLLALCDDKNETGASPNSTAWRASRWKLPLTPCAAVRASIRRRPRASANR